MHIKVFVDRQYPLPPWEPMDTTTEEIGEVDLQIPLQVPDMPNADRPSTGHKSTPNHPLPWRIERARAPRVYLVAAGPLFERCETRVRERLEYANGEQRDP